MQVSIRIDDESYDANLVLHPKPKDKHLGYFEINLCPDLIRSDYVYFHLDLNDISMTGYAVLDRDYAIDEPTHLKQCRDCRFNVLWMNNSQDVVWGIE